MLTAMGRIFESATAGRVKNVDTPRQFKSEKDREIYIVYRQRIEEFLHLFLLWDAMQAGGAPPPNVMGHGSEEFANTLRTATIGWLASLVDKPRFTDSSFAQKPTDSSHSRRASLPFHLLFEAVANSVLRLLAIRRRDVFCQDE